MTKSFTSYLRLSVSRMHTGAVLTLMLILLGLSTKAQNFDIGSGTASNTSTGYPTPYGSFYSGQREQFLYRASELTAAGMTAGVIHQMAFNVTATNGAGANNAYTLKIAGTTLANLTSWQTVTNTVFGPTNLIPSLGWNVYTLSTPFTWNGTDNIIVETCHWNGSYTYTYNASCPYTSVTSACIYYYDDYSGPHCGNNGLSYTLPSTRPNIRFTRLLPCTGTPTAGTVSPTGTVSACTGTPYTLTATGTSVAANLTYQWMQSTNGGVTWTLAAGGTGSTTTTYTTPAISAAIRYHMVVTCTNTGLKDSTANTIFTVTGPTYATIPYVQDFESWVSGCGTSDKPSNSWTNTPFTGDVSWRRYDQGATANWTCPTCGVWTPSAKVGSYCARFHGYYAPNGQQGVMQLYVDCSGFLGPKELQLYLRTDPGTSYPNDSLVVYLSQDGGATFSPTPVCAYGPGSGGWDYYVSTFLSNQPNTVLKFVAKQMTSQYYTDIGLDYVRILPPCAGKPTAGAVTPVTPCPNVNFNLSTTGTTQAAGLVFQWQIYNASTGTWSNIIPGNTSTIVQNISAPTTYRAIVNCTVSGLSDTTAPYIVNLGAFYYCYCGSGGTYTSYTNNIGNVKVNTQPANTTLLNNGNASPVNYNPTAINLYTNFTGTVPPMPVYRDSLYKIFVTEINDQYFYQCTATAYIDYNRNGLFDNNESIFSKLTSTANGQQVSDTFRVPSAAAIGLTGFRVLLVQTTGTVNPCGTYSYGETEDYLAMIQYAPCNGPANAGTAWSSADTVCVGYSVDLTDTTHETQRSGLSWSWEVSTNGGASWSAVPNSTNKDTVNNVVVNAPSIYRLKMVCNITNDITYSNNVTVGIGAPYQCYPLSQSLGSNADSSDVGAFTIGNYIMPIGYIAGPHIGNPLAIRRHTDNTQYDKRIILFADSTYHISVYHTMKSANHQDARVSVFMDFNNDLKYQALAGIYPFGPERVFTGLSTQANWYVDSTIRIPDAVIADVPTGLRVILNNDVNPNSAANLGAGQYVSGETEDYVVIFHRPFPTGLGQTGLVKDVMMYPNPTDGRFTLDVNTAKDIAHMDVVVTTLTGQVVLSKNYEHTGTQFTTNLDLSGKASGVYFVEIRADGDKIVRKLTVRN